MNWRAFGPRRRTAVNATDAGVTTRERAGSHRPAMSGSTPVGPSDDYTALLRGEIEADEYVRRLKATVDARLKRGRRPLADPPVTHTRPSKRDLHSSQMRAPEQEAS